MRLHLCSKVTVDESEVREATSPRFEKVADLPLTIKPRLLAFRGVSSASRRSLRPSRPDFVPPAIPSIKRYILLILGLLFHALPLLPVCMGFRL